MVRPGGHPPAPPAPGPRLPVRRWLRRPRRGSGGSLCLSRTRSSASQAWLRTIGHSETVTPPATSMSASIQPRVLVVDDDKAVRESLRRSLEFNGYAVSLAADGAEA